MADEEVYLLELIFLTYLLLFGSALFDSIFLVIDYVDLIWMIYYMNKKVMLILRKSHSYPCKTCFVFLFENTSLESWYNLEKLLYCSIVLSKMCKAIMVKNI